MRYKDFPKHDFRRCLAVLRTVEELGQRATMHYVALALECTRAEVSRAIELAQHQFRVVVEKSGSVYQIRHWGYINRAEVSAMLRPSFQLECEWQGLREGTRMWSREREAQLVEAVANAVAMHRSPTSDEEADVYRLSAQLLKTRYASAAKFLDHAAYQYYRKEKLSPRPFAKVVSDGLVSDVPRLRNRLERRMNGVHSW